MTRWIMLVGLAFLMAGCSWQDALITGGTVGAVLAGPPLITTQMYTHEHMAQLRQQCVAAPGDTDSVDCRIYFAEMSTCLNHLGLIATEGWRNQCEGA